VLDVSEFTASAAPGGALATGLFARVAVNSNGGNGNGSQVLIRLAAVVCSWVWAGGVTFVLLLLKVLDASIHGEPAYAVEI
jgi:ammonia channel protein AmtB